MTTFPRRFSSAAASTPNVAAALLALVAAPTLLACSAFSKEDDADPQTTPETTLPERHPDAGPAKALPPIVGTPSASELTEAFGIFVAQTGELYGPGSRSRPLASIQSAIELATRANKRVYVCAGTYHEALVLADGVSIIGGLDCSDTTTWHVGKARSRIESPTSPAIRARDITTDTRLEGLDIVAPAGSAQADDLRSSIGLIAERSPKLLFTSSSITANDAANGGDGIEGIQLVETGAAAGAAVNAAECIDGLTCSRLFGIWYNAAGGAGGTSICSGAPNHNGEAGGGGGKGGLWETFFDSTLLTVRFRIFSNQKVCAPGLGLVRSSLAGTNGSPHANAPAVGGFLPEGYVALDGENGSDGTPGAGGAGGNGTMPTQNAASSPLNGVWRGNAGAGGGAGGCPGLGGTGGKGGGASIGALLFESPLMFDDVTITSARGGDAGRGVFGSDPLPGGAPGNAVIAATFARGGGNGGAAGVSGNGSAGPSLGIAHVGPAPAVRGGTQITVGLGGAAIPERTATDALGNVKTIHPTSPGLAKPILAL